MRSLWMLFHACLIFHWSSFDLAASDYQKEVDKLDIAVNKAEAEQSGSELDTLRLAHVRYRRASLTGDVNELVLVERKLADALQRASERDPVREPTQFASEMLTLQVRLCLKLHRPSEAEIILKNHQLPGQMDLEAELALQQEDLVVAGQKVQQATLANSSWDNLARWAHYHAMMGRIELADRLYTQAQDELTSKEMRYFAWLELQRGRLDFMSGKFEDAQQHYQLADSSYTGYWQIQESIAELTAATNKLPEAVSLYQSVLAVNPRAETKLALGMLFRQMGQMDQSREFLDRAHHEFLGSAKRGETHYLHHLVEYYTELQGDSNQALQWAEKDFQLRPNTTTRQALAWCLFLTGESEAALPHIERALHSGIQDPHMYQRASRIYKSMGMNTAATSARERSTHISPRQDAFHMHY